MLLGETDPDARHVGPLHAVDGDGNPVLGEDFSGAGELEIKVGGGAFATALGTIVETGSGYYYYLATAADALVGPWIEIKIAGVCQEFTLREDVKLQLEGIIAGETDPDLLVIGSLRFIDADGNPLGAADIAAATKEVSINGAALGAPAGTFSCVDDGYLDYIADPTEVTDRGWVAVRISGTCQEIMFREDIVVEAKNATAPEIEIVSPTPGVAPGQPGGFPASRRAAERTPIVLRITDDAPGLGYIEVAVRFYGSQAELDADENGVEETVFRKGQFRGKHVASSYVEDIDDGVELHVFRDGGWLGRFIKFAVDPIDEDGNLTNA